MPKPLIDANYLLQNFLAKGIPESGQIVKIAEYLEWAKLYDEE